MLIAHWFIINEPISYEIPAGPLQDRIERRCEVASGPLQDRIERRCEVAYMTNRDSFALVDMNRAIVLKIVADNQITITFIY